MDGENDVMTADERTDAAMAMFDSPTETQDGSQSGENSVPSGDAGTAGSQGDASGETGSEGQQPDSEVQAEALSDEQLNADPRYQELAGYRSEVEGVLSEFDIPDLGEAKLQLADSQVLYKIVRGEGSPSQLLDAMAQNAGWSDQQKQLVANDLIGWLQKSGYLKGEQGQARKGDVTDPLADRVSQLERSGKDAAAAQERAKVEAHRAEVFGRFEKRVGELCAQKKIPAEYVADYVMKISNDIRGNKAMIDRIEDGNWVDVQRLFAKHHNAEVTRMQKFSAGQVRQHDNKQRQNPRIPAGGAPPAPAAAARPTLARNRNEAAANAEQRRQRAADML